MYVIEAAEAVEAAGVEVEVPELVEDDDAVDEAGMIGGGM